MAFKKHFSIISAFVLGLLLLFATTVTANRHLLVSPNGRGFEGQEADDAPWENSHGGWGGGRLQNHTPQRKAKVKT
ncbi:unnamed protein product [Citrullus colocynthis]|uniref:Glycine-rich protein n=1 Tax=Citrullus colocynthis TaxID=252529 RepID=A0ABP0XV06_9ROSI